MFLQVKLDQYCTELDQRVRNVQCLLEGATPGTLVLTVLQSRTRVGAAVSAWRAGAARSAVASRLESVRYWVWDGV